MLTSVFSPSGQHFALATPREIRLYDQHGGLTFRIPQAEPFATQLHFVGNTHLLIVSSTRVQEWTLKGEPRHSTQLDLGRWQGGKNTFLGVEGETFIFVTEDREALLVSRQTGKVLGHFKLLPPHEEDQIWAGAVFSPETSLIATSAEDAGTIRVWDLQGNQVRVIQVAALSSTHDYSFHFVAGGHELLVTSREGWTVYHARTGAMLEERKQSEEDSWIPFEAFVGEGQDTFQVMNTNILETWTLHPLRRRQARTVDWVDPVTDRVQIGGNSVMSEGHLVDLQTGNRVRLGSFRKTVLDLAFRPDNQLFVVNAWDIEVWDAHTFTQLPGLSEPQPFGKRVSFNQNNYQLLTGGEGVGGLYLHDSTSGNFLKRVNLMPFFDAKFSVDGQKIYVAFTDSEMGLFNASTLELEHLQPAIEADAVAIQPQGQDIATILYQGGIEVWTADLKTQKFSLDGPVMGLDYTPDGKRLVVMHDGGALVLSPEDGSILMRLPFEGSKCLEPKHMAVSRESVLAATRDRNLCLFDLSTGDKLQEVLLTDVNTALAFAPTGKVLLAGSQHGLIEVFQIDPD